MVSIFAPFIGSSLSRWQNGVQMGTFLLSAGVEKSADHYRDIISAVFHRYNEMSTFVNKIIARDL